jgi:hypothetical protein
MMDRYPNEMAALLAFDLLIGNCDRGQSIKAALVTPQIRLFAAYDHSHALLNIEEDPWQSIERLNSEEWIVQFHPCIARVTPEHIEQWIERMSTTPLEYIQECCILGRPFQGVSMDMQEALANALDRRMGILWELFESDAYYLTRQL